MPMGWPWDDHWMTIGWLWDEWIWDDYEMTMRLLWFDYEMTMRWLWDDYDMTTIDDYEMTLIWLWDDWHDYDRWLWDDYEMTMRWLWNDYEMTMGWLANYMKKHLWLHFYMYVIRTVTLWKWNEQIFLLRFFKTFLKNRLALFNIVNRASHYFYWEGGGACEITPPLIRLTIVLQYMYV